MLKKAFNGCQEDRTRPPHLTGDEVYNRVSNIKVNYGKTVKHSGVRNIWKKKSIFFKLLYWSKLDVRHCIDVMHVEKNVCDSIIRTLLNIKGKTKDGINARKELIEMGVCFELQPQPHGKRTYLPPACHTLSKYEKISFCGCLRGVKVPQGSFSIGGHWESVCHVFDAPYSATWR